MTDSDEKLLTAAKLREQIHGRLDSDIELHPHTGIFTNQEDRKAISFVESAFSEPVSSKTSFRETKLGKAIYGHFGTETASEALDLGNSQILSNLVSMTEVDIEADEFTYLTEILDRVENNGAPLFLVGFGLPNTGKTGHILHDWFRAWRKTYPDGVLLTNANLPSAHRQFTSLQALVGFCLDNPNTRKFIFIDEGSTHFDARTNSHEVAAQFSPFSKRFAKLSIDFATIGHTIKDVHPEVKRQTTTFFHKPGLKQVQFYDDFVEDQLTSPVFPEPIEGLEKPTIEYDPDDWSPLHWDLDPAELTDPEQS